MRTTLLIILGAITLFAFFGCVTAPPLTPEELAVKQRILRDITDKDLAKSMMEFAKTRITGGPEFYGSKASESRKKEPPVALSMLKPIYPFELRKAHVQGLVWIAFVIDRQGRPSEVQSLSDDQQALSAAAIAAVKQWKFRPAMIEGKPEPTRIAVPIGFTVD